MRNRSQHDRIGPDRRVDDAVGYRGSLLPERGKSDFPALHVNPVPKGGPHGIQNRKGGGHDFRADTVPVQAKEFADSHCPVIPGARVG